MKDKRIPDEPEARLNYVTTKLKPFGWILCATLVIGGIYMIVRSDTLTKQQARQADLDNPAIAKEGTAIAKGPLQGCVLIRQKVISNESWEGATYVWVARCPNSSSITN